MFRRRQKRLSQIGPEAVVSKGINPRVASIIDCAGSKALHNYWSSVLFINSQKSLAGLLQIRQLGQHKMHPMIASFGCNSENEIIPIAKHMPWIREVTKSANLEYNYTDEGLGEKCFKTNNVTGICLPLESCPMIFKNIKDIKKHSAIDQCGFEGNNMLVCCTKQDMRKGPDTEARFRDIVHEIEDCEMLYDEFRRTPEEHQLHSQVAIIDGHDSTNCSATLITARYLLTSAQCVFG